MTTSRKTKPTPEPMRRMSRRRTGRGPARRPTTTVAKLRAGHEAGLRAQARRAKARLLAAKPKLRGVLHLVTFPLCIAASVVLIVLARGALMKTAVSVFAATAILLFGNSALLHIGHGRWPMAVERVLRQIDYSNIFLIIAGTNTPFLMAFDPRIRWPYLAVVWAAAIAGTVCHVIWPDGKDVLFTVIYIVLGLAPVVLLPFMWTNPFIGPAGTVLIASGGACYIAGAVCFARRSPNPVPGWFGYHELFHLGTVAGYACHVVAMFLTVCAMR
ncbi:PAQR family membrane homeostasis protein TrhA [Bifidobacterium pullorum]|nr:hemolysin III family protein [Bifidobacterium pullorum]